jgi:hypothetical protein
MATRQPRRFARLALKIPAHTSEEYLGAIMRAFSSMHPPDDVTEGESRTWEPVSASEVEAVYKHASELGHGGVEHSLCVLVRNRPDAGWSQSVIQEICRFAATHPDPGIRELTVVKEWEDRTVYDLETAAINHVRGPAAQAIPSLLSIDSALLQDCRSAIEALITDPHPGVRVAAMGICLPVWDTNPDLALDWFLRICECDDYRILPTQNAVRFVNRVQSELLSRIEPVIYRMVNSEIDEVREHGAGRAAFIWLHSGDLANLLDECLCGRVSHRKGVATVAAQNSTDANCGVKSRGLLTRMFEDPDDQVRAAAVKCFRRSNVFECNGMPHVVAAYLSSQAFQDDPTGVLRAFAEHKGSLIPFAETLFAVCEVLSGRLASDSRSLGTWVGFEADRVPILLLRLYEQAQGKALGDVQDRCLDTWDLLLENRVGTVRSLIEKIDLS